MSKKEITTEAAIYISFGFVVWILIATLIGFATGYGITWWQLW